MELSPRTPERKRRPKSEAVSDIERLSPPEAEQKVADDPAERLRAAEARLREELKHEQDPLERAKLVAAANQRADDAGEERPGDRIDTDTVLGEAEASARQVHDRSARVSKQVAPMVNKIRLDLMFGLVMALLALILLIVAFGG